MNNPQKVLFDKLMELIDRPVPTVYSLTHTNQTLYEFMGAMVKFANATNPDLIPPGITLIRPDLLRRLDNQKATITDLQKQIEDKDELISYLRGTIRMLKSTTIDRTKE